MTRAAFGYLRVVRFALCAAVLPFLCVSCAKPPPPRSGPPAVWASHFVGTGTGKSHSQDVAVAPAGGGGAWLAHELGGGLSALGSEHKRAVALSRIEADGSIRWTRPLAGDARSERPRLAPDGRGGVYLALSTRATRLPGESPRPKDSDPATGWDAVVQHIDAEGRTLWSRRITTPHADRALALCRDRGGVVLVGGTEFPEPMPDPLGTEHPDRRSLFLARFGPDGDGPPPVSFNLVRSETVRAAAVGRRGRVWLAGEMWPGPGPSQAFVAAVDPDDTATLVLVFGDPDEQTKAEALAVTPAGPVVVGEYCHDDHDTTDDDPNDALRQVHVTRLDHHGHLLGRTLHDLGTVVGVTATRGGGCVVAGGSGKRLVANGTDILSEPYLAQFNQRGELSWAARVGAPGDQMFFPTDATFGGNGTVYLAGTVEPYHLRPSVPRSVFFTAVNWDRNRR